MKFYTSFGPHRGYVVYTNTEGNTERIREALLLRGFLLGGTQTATGYSELWADTSRVFIAYLTGDSMFATRTREDMDAVLDALKVKSDVYEGLEVKEIDKP